jgi:hypothetical protein
MCDCYAFDDEEELQHPEPVPVVIALPKRKKSSIALFWGFHLTV